MKFLVDAQLPSRLGHQLAASGHDALHTSQLPSGNRTTDAELATRADDEGRVLITKDRDFRASHLLRSTPQHLLLVSTGNARNVDLLALFERHLSSIIAALEEARFIELGTGRLIVHDDQRRQR